MYSKRRNEVVLLVSSLLHWTIVTDNNVNVFTWFLRRTLLIFAAENNYSTTCFSFCNIGSFLFVEIYIRPDNPSRLENLNRLIVMNLLHHVPVMKFVYVNALHLTLSITFETRFSRLQRSSTLSLNVCCLSTVLLNGMNTFQSNKWDFHSKSIVTLNTDLWVLSSNFFLTKDFVLRYHTSKLLLW